MGLTTVNELFRSIFFILDIFFLVPIFLQYNVCKFELPFPGLYPYPAIVQEFIHNLILVLNFPGLFIFPVMFPYPVKYLMGRSEYFFERNNNYKQNLSGLNDYFYVLTYFMI